MTSRIRLIAVLAGTAVALPSVEVDAQSLRGSRVSVNRMHREAVRHDLYFYRTSGGVRQAAQRARLVRLNGNANYAVVQMPYPYAQPTTRMFLERLGAQYRAACGEKLVVTSAVRPATRQPRNASPKSVHPTGIAVDLRKSKNARCLTWLRRTLLSLEASGVIEATEEFRPPHFHVAIFPQPYRQHVARLTRGSSTVARAAGGSAKSYRVRDGDTLWAIAERHETSVQRLISANELDGSTIVPGQRLRVPVGG